MLNKMTTFGERVKQKRIELGLNQAELAKRADLSQQAIAQAEKKGRGSKHILKIAAALNVSPEWLETGDEIPKRFFSSIPISKWSNNFEIDYNQDLIFKDNYIFLKVPDDSMENTTAQTDTFLKGTIIIVDPSKKSNPNNYVIARKKDRPDSIPIFRKYATDYIQESLIPLNPAYSVYFLKDFDIVGVVVASMNLDL